MLTTIQGKAMTTHENGDVTIDFLVNGPVTGGATVETSILLTPEQLGAAVNPFQSYDSIIRMCLASWLGVDPAGSDPSKLLDFVVEIDFSQVQAVRRVLPL